ncbi:MAG: hypothetical protein KKE79_07365, partial [Actinobacteria bacterium]|nr:hypothetical protein [Actinomycetota bacterium]MBU4386531.1 hypothetical protein [Actinomycetota bacterium]MBU4490437.1 hypothetical protein [Actinomycetota bacterium]MCG2794611.1 hypothetical protein [Actinomycetes bacterium]
MSPRGRWRIEQVIMAVVSLALGAAWLSAPFHKYGVVSRAPRRRSCKARDRAVLREYREGAERSRCGCIDVR